MPRKAARIFLRVTGVRVERLQDITPEGVVAEGIQSFTKDGTLYKYAVADEEGDYPAQKWSDCARTPAEAFERLWDGTYAKRGYSWEDNPWVFVVEFERIEWNETVQ